MRALPTGNGDAQWENSIIKDLSFIKKHLRYPFNKKLVLRSAVTGIIVAYVLRMAWITWIVATSVTKHNFWGISLEYGMIFAILIPLISITIAYSQVFKFKVVPTEFYVAENQQLIQKFLQSQHLAIYRHPEAPEVFQIMSKNISATKREEREVMVFIADDKRILINSHVVSKGFSLTNYSSTHYKAMAKRLNEWIKIHVDSNTNTAIVSDNRF